MSDADKLKAFIENGQAMQRAVDDELRIADLSTLLRSADGVVAAINRIGACVGGRVDHRVPLLAAAARIEEAHKLLQAEISRYSAKWQGRR